MNYLPCSVVRRGQLLPSRLDSSPKLAVVRLELKLLHSTICPNSTMKTILSVDKNYRPTFTTVYWVSFVHHTWIAAVNFNLYERICAYGSLGVCNCYFIFIWAIVIKNALLEDFMSWSNRKRVSAMYHGRPILKILLGHTQPRKKTSRG